MLRTRPASGRRAPLGRSMHTLAHDVSLGRSRHTMCLKRPSGALPQKFLGCSMDQTGMGCSMHQAFSFLCIPLMLREEWSNFMCVSSEPDSVQLIVFRGVHSAHPTPYTLYHTPYTIHHTPYTLHHTPYTLHHTPYTPNPTPFTPHPTPFTKVTQMGRAGGDRRLLPTRLSPRESMAYGVCWA